MLLVSTISVLHFYMVDYHDLDERMNLQTYSIWLQSLSVYCVTLLTHVLELLVSSVVGDLLAQVDEHVVARVIGRA